MQKHGWSKFRSTVQVQRCDLMRGRLQKKTEISKKLGGGRLRRSGEKVKIMQKADKCGYKGEFQSGAQFLRSIVASDVIRRE